MVDWILNIRLNKGPLPLTLKVGVIVGIVILLACVALAYWKPRTITHSLRNRPYKKAALRVAPLFALLLPIGVALLSYGIGFSITYLMSEVWLTFGVELGLKVIRAVALALGLVGFTVTHAIIWRYGRRYFSCFVALFSILFGMQQVNFAYGEYTSLRSLFDIPSYPLFQESDVHMSHHPTVQEYLNVIHARERLRKDHPEDLRKADEKYEQTSHKKLSFEHLPQQGIVRSVMIPGAISGFKPRESMIYLPPAALIDNPPQLPVLIMFSGQPGSPNRLMTASNLPDMLNEYARSHHGLAPIIVAADQLGNMFHNTLCVNSPVYGNVATYLTKDVPHWIERHLPAAPPGKMWGVGGFSQGATCSVQLGTNYPHLFSMMLPVAGELEPTNGSRETMIRDFFHNDPKLYARQVPVHALRHTRGEHQLMVMGAGEGDIYMQDAMRTIGNVAIDTGRKVYMLIALGSNHDWHTVQTVWRVGIELVGQYTGLGKMNGDITHYPNVKMLVDDDTVVHK